MPRLVVLLPPSEGKAGGGRGVRTPGTFAVLEPHRAVVAAAVGCLETAAAQRILGVQDVSAALAADRVALTAPGLPALRRYTGVLYDALGYPGRPAPLRRRLDRSVLVVSGLWGLLRGNDPVPAYKLPIGARLPGLGGLAAWWRPRLTDPLGDHLRGAVVWDLLPGAYAAAAPVPGGRAVWRVRVEREVGGRRSVVGHDNKAVKGALAAAIVEHDVRDPAGLDGWTGPGGYRVESAADGLVTLVTRG